MESKRIVKAAEAKCNVYFFSGVRYKTNNMRLIFLILAIFFFSCTKERSCKTCDTENGYLEATILDSGPVASDGCGWVVRVGDDQYYHPDALDSGFMQNNLKVKICYELTPDQFHCGIAGTGIPVIHVLEIRK